MRVLVTGSAGHLGEGLVRTLRERQHEVVGLDLLESASTTHVGSISDRDFVRGCLFGVDSVIHAATLHKPHIATHSRHAFVETNIAGTLTILEGAVDSGVSGVVFSSTMARRGMPFSGLLYAGLALTANGVRVIEFNARFGDPETQPLLARLATPLGGLLYAAATGDLAAHSELEWSSGAAVAVVLAAAGYPSTPMTGGVITGVDAATRKDSAVIHAGTALDQQGNLISAGGRVLAVVGLGEDVEAARGRAYESIAEIQLEGSFYRHDIAASAARLAVS